MGRPRRPGLNRPKAPLQSRSGRESRIFRSFHGLRLGRQPIENLCKMQFDICFKDEAGSRSTAQLFPLGGGDTFDPSSSELYLANPNIRRADRFRRHFGGATLSALPNDPGRVGRTRPGNRPDPNGN